MACFFVNYDDLTEHISTVMYPEVENETGEVSLGHFIQLELLRTRSDTISNQKYAKGFEIARNKQIPMARVFFKVDLSDS